MRVALSAAGRDLDAPLDPRFGRCQHFVLVNTDDMSYQSLENVAATQGSGAGIAAVQLVANAGADAVIAAHVGPNAYGALSAGGLKVYSFAGGTVRQAVEALQAGQLQEVSSPTVASHFGMGGGGGGGMGMGGGGGRGMGRDPKAGVPPAPLAAQEDPDAEARLKQQVDSLKGQLDDLRAQLERLNRGAEQ